MQLFVSRVDVIVIIVVIISITVIIILTVDAVIVLQGKVMCLLIQGCHSLV